MEFLHSWTKTFDDPDRTGTEGENKGDAAIKGILSQEERDVVEGMLFSSDGWTKEGGYAGGDAVMVYDPTDEDEYVLEAPKNQTEPIMSFASFSAVSQLMQVASIFSFEEEPSAKQFRKSSVRPVHDFCDMPYDDRYDTETSYEDDEIRFNTQTVPRLRVVASASESPKSNQDDSPRSSSSKSRSLSRQPEVTKCIRWFGHGKLWTILAIGAALMGSAFSILTRRSYNFATLRTPLKISPMYDEIDQFGLMKLRVCYNTTISNRVGCESLILSPYEVADRMFELATLFAGLAVGLGTFVTIFVVTSMFWETIDLRPVGVGLLATYFFQSFTMLIFDSEVCKSNKCSIGVGCVYCILSSLCWLSACIATAKMEAFKMLVTRKRRRRSERRAKKALDATQLKMPKDFKREMSSATEKTSTSASSDAGGGGPEDPEVGITV